MFNFGQLNHKLLKLNRILVTGVAGFIGFHLAKRLLDENWQVVGLDNLNEYYDINLKKARLNILSNSSNFGFHKASLEDATKVAEVFAQEKPGYVVNLAAQAGVRHSFEQPMTYSRANLPRQVSVLESVRRSFRESSWCWTLPSYTISPTRMMMPPIIEASTSVVSRSLV